MALQFSSFEVGHNQILWSKPAFAHSGGSGENPVVIQPDGKVAVRGRGVAAPIEPFARRADFAAVIFDGLLMAGRDFVNAHAKYRLHF